MWDFIFFRRQRYISHLGDKVIITWEDESKTGKNNFAFSDISPMLSQFPGFFTARAYLHLWILSAGHRLKSLATHRGSLMTSDCLDCQSLFIATGTKQNENEEGSLRQDMQRRGGAGREAAGACGQRALPTGSAHAPSKDSQRPNLQGSSRTIHAACRTSVRARPTGQSPAGVGGTPHPAEHTPADEEGRARCHSRHETELHRRGTHTNMEGFS